MTSKGFWKTSKNKYILLIILIIICAVLFITVWLNKENIYIGIISTDTLNINRPLYDFKNQDNSIDSALDSILLTFGIKQEWITTEKTLLQKKTGTKAGWFSKTVLIPKDLTSAELNLDINSYLKENGLSSKVNEEILSKDITIFVTDPDSAKTLPAAIIQIIHSDKVNRTSSKIAIILDKISEFNDKDLDKFILTKNEFSYVFPRNLDDIDVQHKLLQHKKDVVINLTLGGKDNYEADFNTELDEKSIRDRVRNFNADFSTINKVLLTKSVSEAGLNSLQNKITVELMKYNITVINDTLLTAAYNSNEKNKIGFFFDTIIQKSALNKSVIAVYPIDKNEFDEFYNRVQIMKKLGYKFLNLTEYFNYTKEELKKQQEKEEKLKQEQLKKKAQENAKKKKTPDKKDTKKKQTTKQDIKKKK